MALASKIRETGLVLARYVYKSSTPGKYEGRAGYKVTRARQCKLDLEERQELEEERHELHYRIKTSRLPSFHKVEVAEASNRIYNITSHRPVPCAFYVYL